MKERPILFSAPMVRALIAGQKTQTRRVAIKTSQPDRVVLSDFDAGEHKIEIENLNCGNRYWKLCPYGVPGDRLWVREAWAHDAESVEQCRAAHQDAMGGNTFGPYYRATESAPDTLHWKPSIHMPRWASRILLEIIGVRVEKLQDISEADAQAEGVSNSLHMPGGRFANENYAHLWWTINGDGSWEANPWVWVIEFKVVKP